MGLLQITEILWKDKLFIFVYLKYFEDFIKTFDKNKEFILTKIEREFGEFLFTRVYILLDELWQRSESVFPFRDRKVAVILLRTINNDGSPRDTKKVLFYLIHELCHLTEKGNYPFGETPEEIHKKFDELAREIIAKII